MESSLNLPDLLGDASQFTERRVVHEWNQFWKGGHLMGLKRVSIALSALFILSAGAALGAEISGRSSTQLLWYNNEFTEDRVFEAAQYLRANVTKVDPAGKLSFFAYGRGAQTIGPDHDTTGRLYYLYADYRDLADKADLRFGRQFVSNASGNAVIDGLKIDLKNIGPVGFSAFGGRDVVFGLDGELGNTWNTNLGISAYLEGFRKTDVEISWLRKWEKSEAARDTLGASFKQYLFNVAKLYGNTKYDLPSEAFVESLIGAKIFPTSDLVITAEYFSSYPTFDTTSIYSVFAVNKYQEALVRADYTLSEIFSVNLGYNRQWFDEGANADVYHIGTGISPVKELRINLEYDNRTGYYGSTNGFMADVDYEINKTAKIAGGITYDVYQRDAITHEEIARRYWLGGKYKLEKNMALSGRIQNDVNARYSENLSGRLVFDYDF
jgi:hypothetical protein